MQVLPDNVCERQRVKIQKSIYLLSPNVVLIRKTTVINTKCILIFLIFWHNISIELSQNEIYNLIVHWKQTRCILLRKAESGRLS